MANTIVAATLTVTITEAISLNGQDKGSTNVLTIGSITEVAQRIVNVPTSEIILLAFAATVPGPGAFNEADVRYMRITNKDDANFVQLTFRDENATEFAIKLAPGHSFIYAGTTGGVVDTMIAAGSALTVPSTFADLVDITAAADTAAVDLELFVAGD
tara:strand:+ start:189 stop:662 length:474 start_codon:yes stop_codon:yes gene_type:complete